MVITMNELKALQERGSIQKCVSDAEKRIDKRIEITVLDSNEAYKCFSVVVGAPITTYWSGRGPLYWLDIRATPNEETEYHSSLGVKGEKRKLAELQAFFEYIESNKQNLFDLCGLKGDLQ